jgi:hypothetical protein
MKNLLLTLALTLAATLAGGATLTVVSCISAPIDLVPTDGAIGRQVERVLVRHDAYVDADLSIGADSASLAKVQSNAVRSLALLGQVRRSALGLALSPVVERHDAYVAADLTLDDLERATYLASSEQLQRLLGPSGE